MAEPSALHVGVDWSGAADASTQRRHVHLAAVHDGEVVELAAGRTRAEVVDHLVVLHEAAAGAMVVGLDLGFAFPSGLTRDRPDLAAPVVWEALADDPDAGGWFGPRSTLRGPAVDVQAFHDAHARDEGRFRRTEVALHRRFRHLRPKPTVDLRGVIPGHVGRQTVRGMGHLARLREAGFAIWPWDPWEAWDTPGSGGGSGEDSGGSSDGGSGEGVRRVVVEAYPSALRDPAVCGHAADDPRLANAPDEHARDALAIALALAAHAHEPPLDPGDGRAAEGAIWLPDCRVARPR